MDETLLLPRRQVGQFLHAPWCILAVADDGETLAMSEFDRPNGRDFTNIGRVELVERGRPPRLRELVCLPHRPRP